MHKHRFDYVLGTCSAILSILWMIAAGTGWDHGQSFTGWVFLCLAIFWGFGAIYWFVRK